MENEKVTLNWDEDKDDKKGSGVSDMIKKVIASGLTSPFLSEEQLKVYLSGLNLPKEVVLQIMKSANRSRQEMVQKVGGEFSKLVQKIDIVKEFKKILQEHKISIQAEIEFVPKKKNETESADEGL